MALCLHTDTATIGVSSTYTGVLAVSTNDKGWVRDGAVCVTVSWKSQHGANKVEASQKYERHFVRTVPERVEWRASLVLIRQFF